MMEKQKSKFLNKIPVYETSGRKKGEINLNPQVFGVKINNNLLYQVVTAYQSNQRRSTASTKTRSEVRGGGKKPYRQKHTGRARAGSIRSPLWRGGGVVFGPRKEENYRKKIPQKIKTKAVQMALSQKASSNQILVLEKLVLSQPKTKEMTKVLDNLPFEGTALLILPQIDESIKRASRNIPYLSILPITSLNALEILKPQYIITTKEGIKLLEERYGK